jgi:hypothetical protein
MPDEFVVCRMLRHNWNLNGFFKTKDSHGANWIVMSLECSHCGMKREDYLDAAGGLKDRFYSPPEGYNISRAKDDRREGRITVAESRAEMLGRVRVYASEGSLNRRRRS